MSTVSIDERFEFATGLIKEAGSLALGFFHRLDTLTVKSKKTESRAETRRFEAGDSRNGRIGWQARCRVGEADKPERR